MAARLARGPLVTRPSHTPARTNELFVFKMTLLIQNRSQWIWNPCLMEGLKFFQDFLDCGGSRAGSSCGCKWCVGLQTLMYEVFASNIFEFQVHDAALLHHRVGRYNAIVRSLIAQVRARRSLCNCFRCWAFRSRILVSAKSQSLKRMHNIIANIFELWRIAALWRIHLDAAFDLALSVGHIVPQTLGNQDKDLPSKASAAASLVAEMLVHHPWSWPNVKTMRSTLNHHRFLVLSVSRISHFGTCGLFRQTLKSLFRKFRSACSLSHVFCSWRRHVMCDSNELQNVSPVVLDGSISDVIASACVSLGRSHPLLLGHCALKVCCPSWHGIFSRLDDWKYLVPISLQQIRVSILAQNLKLAGNLKRQVTHVYSAFVRMHANMFHS
jgi:hypothetical protein